MSIASLGANASNQNQVERLGNSSRSLNRPRGGGSTIGSIIFGGDDPANVNQVSYLDERKTRRFHRRDGPESSNPIVDKGSFYAEMHTREKERLTPPGTVCHDDTSLAVVQHRTMGRRSQASAEPQSLSNNNNNNNEPEHHPHQQHKVSSSAYFAGGMGQGPQNDQSQQRRTRRMFGPPGGQSSFKLG